MSAHDVMNMPYVHALQWQAMFLSGSRLGAALGYPGEGRGPAPDQTELNRILGRG